MARKQRLIVFGAGSKKSLGYQTGKLIEKRGWKVTLADLSPSSMEIFHVDVRGQHGVPDILSSEGPFDAMLYAVGVNVPMNVVEHCRKDFDDVMATNVESAAYCIKKFLSCGRRPGEKAIAVLIGSNTQHVPRRGSYSYAASKAAMGGLTRCLARDLAEEKLAVVQLDFGMIKDSPMTARSVKQFGKPWKGLRYRQMWPYDLTVKEAAEWTAFAIEKGHMATGSCLRIDGAEA